MNGFHSSFVITIIEKGSLVSVTGLGLSAFLWSSGRRLKTRLKECLLPTAGCCGNVTVIYRLTESHVAAVLYVELDPVLHRETAVAVRLPLRRPGSGSGD